MAVPTSTIGDLTEALSVVGDDYIEVEVGGVSYKVKLSVLLGAMLLGEGIVDTNGHTFEIPATGTAALIDVEQTFTAEQTFEDVINADAGVSFGQDALDHHEERIFTTDLVAADASSGGNTTTPPTRYGRAIRTGNKVDVVIEVDDISTAGLTAGNAFFIRGLPWTSAANANSRPTGSPVLENITFAPADYVVAQVPPNATWIVLTKVTSGGAAANVVVSNLTSGTARVHLELTYFVD